MLATAEGAIGGPEYTHLQPAVAGDVSKTVRRMVIASTTAAAPLRELLINFGGSRMMIRPLHEDAVFVVLLERDAETGPIRALLDLELQRLRRVIDGEEVMDAVGVHEGDDEVAELLATPLGPVLREIDAVYQRYRRRVGLTAEQSRVVVHDQLRE
ncbi:MAG: hypothetical protein KC457_15350, partial [Myxococcales bacterium]|nr:hypothetical protein [Myxococcales bacterium]